MSRPFDGVVDQHSSPKKKYGPVTIESEITKIKNGRKLLDALNINKQKIILSLNCERRELDVKIKGKKWKGWMPANQKFEKRLLNDFC